MRILLTGASGFLGGILIDRLLNESDTEIVALYNSSKPKRSNKKLTWLKCDLAVPAEMAAIPDCDAIVHCAQAKNYRDPSQVQAVFQINALSVLSLLEWGKARHIQKFIYTSTGSVYGTRAEGLCSEDQLACPDSLYAASKMAAEDIIHAYATTFACEILRIFTLYGPGQIDRLIPSLIETIRSGGPVFIAGDRGLSVTPVFAEDVAEVIALSLREKSENRLRIVNLAGDEHFSVRQIASMIGDNIGVTPRFEVPAGEARYLLGENQRLMQLYPQLKLTDFTTGLSKTILYSDKSGMEN